MFQHTKSRTTGLERNNVCQPYCKATAINAHLCLSVPHQSAHGGHRRPGGPIHPQPRPTTGEIVNEATRWHTNTTSKPELISMLWALADLRFFRTAGKRRLAVPE